MSNLSDFVGWHSQSDSLQQTLYLVYLLTLIIRISLTVTDTMALIVFTIQRPTNTSPEHCTNKGTKLSNLTITSKLREGGAGVGIFHIIFCQILCYFFGTFCWMQKFCDVFCNTPKFHQNSGHFHKMRKKQWKFRKFCVSCSIKFCKLLH